MTKHVWARLIFSRLSFEEFAPGYETHSCKEINSLEYLPVTFETFMGQSLLYNSPVSWVLHVSSSNRLLTQVTPLKCHLTHGITRKKRKMTIDNELHQCAMIRTIRHDLKIYLISSKGILCNPSALFQICHSYTWNDDLNLHLILNIQIFSGKKHDARRNSIFEKAGTS